MQPRNKTAWRVPQFIIQSKRLNRMCVRVCACVCASLCQKGPYSQSYDFSSSHVHMWDLNHKESWVPVYWCFWTVVLEKALKSTLDSKEIKPAHLKGNQSRIFTGRTDAEVEAPTLWPPDMKNWLIGKDPDAGEDWRQEEETTENEMVGWHHWLDGHEFKQALEVGNGLGSLVCCSPWGHKELDTTEGPNWTVQFSQHQLLKRLCFLHCVFLPLLF